MFSYFTTVSASLSQDTGQNKSRGCGLKFFKHKFSSGLLNISNHLVLRVSQVKPLLFILQEEQSDTVNTIDGIFKVHGNRG